MGSVVKNLVGISGVKVLCLLLIISMPNVSAKGHEADDNKKEWCVADGRQSDDVLQKGLDRACGTGNADCSQVQPIKPCYQPNTVKDHASFAFNSYWQKSKQQGATCTFNGAAMLTTIDPSHDSCKFECTS